GYGAMIACGSVVKFTGSEVDTALGLL
ncbi:hypothetical protein A2U01_0116828, partial [Trifolium medium]|nr:hypothetical protein [Trifolium medium]